MTDSSDKKSKEILDNFDVDLDAIQDELEFPAFSMNEFQDDEEAIDRLLMNDDFDDAAEQPNMEAVSTVEALDDFSDFSDFDEPEVISTVVADESDQIMGDSDAVEADEVDDFFGLNDDFDELDLIQDDEAEASPPTVVDLAAVNGEPQAAIEESDEDEDELEALDDFSDFSDFDESEIMPTVETEEAVQAAEDLSVHGYDIDLTNEADDFSSLTDDFDELDLIQDDEVEVSADVVEQPADDEGAINSLVLDAAVDSEDVLAKTDGEEDKLFNDVSLSDDDEADDFSSLTDDFDELDLIQDDEVEVSADVVEQSADDEGTSDSLIPDAGFDSEDGLEKTDELFDDAGLSDEIDDFDDSDMIQIDEVDDWADLVTTSEEPLAVVEDSFNDLLDDENDVDSLLLDSGFEEEDALEQAIGKKDEFGDDTDLVETDSFFQLDEVSDDFSSQAEAVQLAETEIFSTQDEQEDDFLLPDFDITADTEVSDVGNALGAKEDQIGDAFGNIDFLNEEEALKVFGPEAAELKPGGNEDVVEPKSKPAAVADTVMATIEDPEDLKLSPFGFEQEDIKKQLEDAENKVKKAKLFSYVAMGFGTVALSAAVGLGVVTYRAKSEFSRLTEVVSTLEANLAKSTENNSNIVVKQDMVSKELDMLQVKMGDLENDNVPLAPSIAEPAKVEAAHEPVAPVKAENASEPAKAKTAAEHEPALSKDETTHKTTPVLAKVEAVPAKTKNQSGGLQVKEKIQPEAVPAKTKGQPEALQVKEKTQPEAAPSKAKAQPEEAVAAKPKAAEKIAVKPEPVKEKKQAAPGKWGVNLGAFKQEWFAKSKAAEYAQQGVLAEVMPVHEKNTTMYRLRVMGFKTKAEAHSNTDRIKKALNLDSVWVSDN